MKKVIEFFKNWFQKNGLLKILVAFVLLVISAVITANTHSTVFTVLGWVALCYLIITIIIFFIAGIYNSINNP